VMDDVRAHFRPEFLNRLDEILLFRRLSRHDLTRIVTVQMKRLQNLLDDKHITLECSEDALEWLGNQGYDPAYGARPLKRLIQRSLQNPLAEQLLSGTIQDGQTVYVELEGNGLVLRTTPTAPTAEPLRLMKS